MKTPLAKQLTGLILATGLLIGSIAIPVFPRQQVFQEGIVNKARTRQKPGQQSSQPAHPESNEQTKKRAGEAYGKLPINFEVNRGQTEGAVKFLARGRGYNLFLTATEAVLSLRKEVQREKNDSLMAKAGRGRKSPLLSHSSTTSTLRMKVVGANPQAQVKGEQQLPGTINYFTGRDARKWKREVSSYAKVRYQNVYPGVDMIYYGNQRELEYDFVVAPGANPDIIKLAFAGAQKMSVAENGDLVLRTAAGELHQRKPVTYQETNGSKHTVVSRYVIKNNQVGFEVGDYDRNKPLIIDPILSYSTYLGGSGDYEAAFGVTVDADGNAYIVGTTASADYPATTGAVQTTIGGSNALGDVFVTKLNAAGTSLVYSTYLGGSDSDYGQDIEVDTDGNAYVMGITVSSDFPTTSGALQSTAASSNGSEDGFVTKLNAAGSSILYSTYLGGSAGEDCRAIAINSLGEVYITGGTQSADFPTTTGAYQTVLGSNNHDAFVTKLNATGTALIFSTFIGGTSATGHDLALDSSGNVFFAGEAYAGTLGGGSTVFTYPVTSNAYQSAAAADGFEGFMSEVSADGTQLLYSSYLGGSMEDSVIGVAIDADDKVYVAGYTGSSDFPVTSGCAQPIFGGPYDTFISKFDFSSPNAVSLVYSTYLGGSNLEDPYGIAVDVDGNAYVAGYTTSYDFPVTQTSSHGWLSVFVTKLNAAGSQFLDSACFGEVYTYAYGLALDSEGNAYVVGETTTSDFPTTPGSYQTTFGDGGSDAFVTKLDFVTQHADLAIEFSSMPETAPPGSQLTYNIGVLNNGPHQASSVTLTDALPSGVSFVSASSTQGSCNETSGTVTCDLGNLAQNSDASVSIVVNITAATGTTLENTASVSSTVTDPNTSNNSADTSTEVLVTADVSAYATADPHWVASGSNVTYTVYVTNNGPSLASSVTLTGTLPPGVTLISMDNNYGSCTSAPATGGGTQVDCTLGDTILNNTKTLSFTGSATGSSFASLPFVATIGSATADLYTWNNTVNAAALIASPPVPTPTPGPTDELQLAYTSYVNSDTDIYRQRADGAGLVNLTNNPIYEDNFIWSPDGSRLAFLRFDYDYLTVSLCVVDADGSNLTVLTNVSGEYIDSFSWAPDGSQLAFEGRSFSPSTTSEVYVINVDGTGRYSLSGSDCFNTKPSWSPDGTRISYLHLTYNPNTAAMNYIRVVNPDGTNLITVAHDEDERDFAPEWSPDSTQLVFVRAAADSSNDIYTVHADGTDLLRLTNDSFSHSLNPHWSPDGTRVSFGSDLSGGSTLEIINADGSGRTALTIPSQDSVYYSSGSEKWSPDGTRLAFSYVIGWGESGNVCIINADDTGLHCFGNALEYNQDPDWSPDGSRLAFKSRRNGLGSIDIINVDGTGRVDLTNQDGYYGTPKWRPEP